MPVRTKDVMADIRLRILDRERSLYWNLYTNGVISSGTQRRLNAAVDEQYDQDGKKPLCARGDIFEFCEEPSWIISMKFFSRFFQKMGRYLLSRQNYFRIRFGKGIDHSPENMSSSIDNNSSKSPFIMYGKHWRILSIGQSHHFNISNRFITSVSKRFRISLAGVPPTIV